MHPKRHVLVQRPHTPHFLSKYGCGKTHLVGEKYSGMVSAVSAKLNQIGTKGVDYEIAGFAWFQGWSDATSQPDWVEDECKSHRHRTSFWTHLCAFRLTPRAVHPSRAATDEVNLVDFVQDVRAAFNEPALPFIIGGPGMDGYNSRGKAVICNAQSRAATRPEINLSDHSD